MKRNSLGHAAAAIACLAMVLPTTAMANQPSLRATDVALRQGGLLVGQVVDPQGAPKAGAVVSVRYGQHEIVRTTADANGVFAAQGLRGGQYQLVTEEGQSLCRLWAAETAPPVAQTTALVVSGNQVVRGQWGPPSVVGDWVEWVKCHPYLTAGVVAAAIAIPLALADDWDSGS